MSDPVMGSQPADTEPVSSPADGQGAAGAALLRERRRQGLSLGDISRQLKLSVRQVEALERDDYSGYKSPVFIHGFIRNYAKLLGLDPEHPSGQTAARVRLVLNPGQTAGLDSEEGKSLNFTCGDNAAALFVDKGDREQLLASQGSALPTAAFAETGLSGR